MPPFLAPREPCDHLIAEDKDLNKFSDSGHIFIDISLNIPKTVSFCLIYYTYQILQYYENRTRYCMMIAAYSIFLFCLQKRLIVVREPDGRLRHANWNERERMLQIFYPAKGKLFHTPVMFNPDALEVSQTFDYTE